MSANGIVPQSDEKGDFEEGKAFIHHEKDNEAKTCEEDSDDHELEELYKQMPITEETRCGLGCFSGPRFQKLANKKVFITLYGFTGCLLSSTYAYFNGTITTIEKRFKIPSKATGVISIGNDITQLLASVLISYYGGKGHRPRWIACGLYFVAAYCFLTAMPHFIYGPGEDALMLTVEYGNSSYGQNFSLHSSKHLCLPNDGPECDKEEDSLAPQAFLFIAQLISGIGGTVYFSLGFSYMDDNIKKSKSPVIISFSYFIRTLGPPIGYALVSACLKLYIAPDLTPVINNKDPRWLGAWWLGWIIQGIGIIIMATLLALLPKSLPRAAARKELLRQKSKDSKHQEPETPSLNDMVKSLKRIIGNRIYSYSHLSSVFYVFGYLPYWIYLPKYIEMQYRQSASASSFATGVVGLVCSALGILISGIVIQKFKPKARYMAGWNVFISAVSFGGILAYTFLGCVEVDKQFTMIQGPSMNETSSCSAGCGCEFAKYSPVCAADGSSTYISACHAGCTTDLRAINGTKIFTNCSCVDSSTYDTFLNDSQFSDLLYSTYPGLSYKVYPEGGVARSGPCSVDCLYQFYCFLGIVCLLKFIGATGRVTNFLVAVRCVEEKDKALSIGIGMTAVSLFALMPSPIIFGYIIDSACLVWGKTCSGSGNCWLYNAEELRYKLNFTSAVFVGIGTLFDLAVWFVAKTLNVYDDNIPNKEDECDINTEDSGSEDGARLNSSFGTDKVLASSVDTNRLLASSFATDTILSDSFDNGLYSSVDSKNMSSVPLNSSVEISVSVNGVGGKFQ